MGTVWEGQDEKLGRPVAIKVMAQDLAQMNEARQRFEREAMAVAQLHSMHVVQVYDYGIQEGLPYIVMELLDGENLSQRLRRYGRLDPETAATIFQQICKGLKAAHAAALIHRDLKPSNIFIASRDDAEVIKLLDFGVVKALDQTGQTEATVTGLLLGTPQYMSPEQARATRDIDHRSDLWSAGVILFRMLTGNNPFKGESVGDVVLKICSDNLPSIRAQRPELPVAIEGFFDKAFARHPDQRFQSADELSQALTQVLVPSQATGMVSQSGFNHAIPPGLRAAARLDEAPVPSENTPSAGAHGPPAMRPQVPSSSGVVPAMISGPTPMSLPSYDVPTPISTTVGGTQLLSNVPPSPQPLGGQPLTLVVAAAAGLISVGLVAAIWIGSSSAVDPPAYAPASTPAPAGIDYLSADDEDERNAAEVATELNDDTTTAPVEDETEANSDAGAEDDTPAGQTPGPTSTVPIQPLPKPKSGKKRPDWGIMP